MRPFIIASLIAAAALVTGGCGMSSSTTGGATAQPLGPAAPPAGGAPPAVRVEPPSPMPPAEPQAHVAVFLHPVGAGFGSVSLAVGTASLLATEGTLVKLETAPADSIRGAAFGLIAHGDVAPGKYAGLTLELPPDAHHSSLTFAAGEPAAPVRVPRSVDLALAPVELRADEFTNLVITLDLGDLGAAREVALGARRFRAGLLPKEETCELKGQVAPAAALARAYACWAGTGVALAVSQPDPFTGQYAMGGLPPGEYRLRVIAAGYEAYRGPERPLILTAGAAALAAPVALAPASSPDPRPPR